MKPEAAAAPALAAADHAEIPDWAADDHAAALATFRRGCRALAARAGWRDVCERAGALPPDATREAARAFFESEFVAHRVILGAEPASGIVTGYYEPLLRGRRERGGAFVHPILGTPDDLLVVDLGPVSPDTRSLRLRGRVEGRRVVPYYSRGEIVAGSGATAGKEIVWVDDPIELFFLQIQGSGRVSLPGGAIVRVGYADQNGHPYRSIGRYLIDKGELTLPQASMQGIQAWARANPGRLEELLNHNPSYVFFRELPPPEDPALGPPGALGIALTPERSVAIDPGIVPLGAPVFLATTRPNSTVPLNRLMVAQDTGGAIRGAARADFFWGFGPDAAREAGRMRQPTRMWVLLPRGFPVPAR